MWNIQGVGDSVQGKRVSFIRWVIGWPGGLRRDRTLGSPLAAGGFLIERTTSVPRDTGTDDDSRRQAPSGKDQSVATAGKAPKKSSGKAAKSRRAMRNHPSSRPSSSTRMSCCTIRTLFVFEDNDIVIPFAVLEELDKFKSNLDDIGRNARIDPLSGRACGRQVRCCRA